ncbi:MAG: chemotaxis protein CheC [Peptococcaceae bacterium]|nr:chemotaxis protein CheC [Peptococcaceae bacterium]
MANDATNYNEKLTENELDVIGEVMNISMGSAATAVSAMLDKQVTITTPGLKQSRFGDVNYSDMDPSVLVKINYVEGINGTNVIMFRGRDMQIILNLLMGEEVMPGEDSVFEFDEMSMSAACEVMNQMMGSSATALSEVLGRTVNISTPTAHISERGNNVASSLMELDEGEPVVCISFNLMVESIMDSNFISFLSLALAKEIISSVMPEEALQDASSAPMEAGAGSGAAAGGGADGGGTAGAGGTGGDAPEAQVILDMAPMSEVPPMPELPPLPSMTPDEPKGGGAASVGAGAAAVPGQTPQTQAPPPQMASPPPPPPQAQAPPPQAPPPPPPPPQAQAPPPPQQMPPQMPQAPPQQQAPQMAPPPMYGYPPQMAPQQMPYGMDFNAGQRMVMPMSQLNIKVPQYPDFSEQAKKAISGGGNINLLLGVPLEVSIVIGKTRRKIKDILEFGQGTVLELEKQTGAPAEIIVNGQLLAYGDVIVIGDNFGVRITEIVGTKELMDSLDGHL